MKKAAYLKEPGFVSDVIFLFINHFNREFFLSKTSSFLGNTNTPESIRHHKHLAKITPEISERLRVFFHLGCFEKSFMTDCFFDPCGSLFIKGEFDLTALQNALSNSRRVVSKMLRFYFDKADRAILEECESSLTAVNRLVSSSNYGPEMKSALLSFFIDPETTLDLLNRELTEKTLFLEKIYRDSEPEISKLREGFDHDRMVDGMRHTEQLSIIPDDRRKIYVSFTLCNIQLVKFFYCEDSILWILGKSYIDFLNEQNSPNGCPDFGEFGYAISEPNRVSILDLIVQCGEVTVKDVEREFGLTSTNAYYHISLMQKTGMLRSRLQGRTMLYSINEEYFRKLRSVLDKYIKTHDTDTELY